MTPRLTDEARGDTTTRPVWAWPRAFGIVLLTIWALAGCFMEGEDELKHKIPWLVVLGGGVAGERLDLACELFAQGHGREGVAMTGRNTARIALQRGVLTRRCGVPDALLHHLHDTDNSFADVTAVAALLKAKPGAQAILVSDSLHMPRLRYLRDRLGLHGQVFLRQSRLAWKSDLDYLLRVALFWFREPPAYVYYRLRY